MNDRDFGGWALGCIGAAVLGVLLFLFLTVTIVPAGNVGVMTSFGAVQKETLDPGFHLRLPIVQGLHLVNTQVQAHQFQQIDAASQELQSVKLTGKVNYRIDARHAADLYQNVGLDFAEKFLDPSFNDYIKTVVPTYPVNDILSHRDAIRDATAARLQEAVSQYGITIVAVQITDIRFSEQFEKAIEAKQVAQQQVAQATQLQNKAAVDAKTAAIAAQGQAAANAALNASLTPTLVAWEALQIQRQEIAKWNGVMPQVTGGANPFVTLATPK